MALDNKPQIFNLDDKIHLFNLTAKQNDTTGSRSFTFKLIKNSIPFNLTGLSVRVGGVKADGKPVFNDCNIVDVNKGLVELELTTQMLTAAGTLDLELIILQGNIRLSTIPFEVEIIPSVTKYSEIVSSNEYGALNNALNKADEYGQKLKEGTEKIELTYADKLNSLDSQLSENESNLTKNIAKTNNLESNKMDKNTTDISVMQINKNKGKIDQTYFTDELLRQMHNELPINAVPADGSIITAKNAYPTVVGKYISKNLIDPNRCIQGYYVGYTDGDLNPNPNYYASDFIPVEPGEKYRINYNEQFAFYDVNKTYVSGIPGSANAVITIPSGACYVRLSIKNSQLSTVQFEKGEKITSYESGSPVIPYNAIEKIANFYVGEDEYFKTITDAINYVKTLDNSKQYTIIIKDGIYLESLNLESNKNINIIGLNKETCIIEDRSGDYSNAPLTLNGNGYFANLTFYSNHKNATEYKLRSYGMHFEGDHDLDIKTYCEFDNCKFISEQNSAIGVGMRKDETLKFKSCEFVQKSTDPYDAGSIYVHSSPFNQKNQNMIFENCIASNDNGFILGIDDSNSMNGGENGAEVGDCTITFINNNFWSNTNGKNSSAIRLRGASANEGCIIGKIKLEDRSFGNNIAMLNR